MKDIAGPAAVPGKKTLAIIQSNYIPWKGYFDLINSADEFIIYDHVQYTKNDWRNRNQLKSKTGLQWITIPVSKKGKFGQTIAETEPTSDDWASDHLKTITTLYSRARYFADYKNTLHDLYDACRDERSLSKINFLFIRKICEILSISTKISWSSAYQNLEGRTENLVNLCQQAGAVRYISGPSAQNYIDAVLFEKANIELSYIDYSDYPEYSQLWPPFRHEVSIWDLILNEGPRATRFLKSFTR